MKVFLLIIIFLNFSKGFAQEIENEFQTSIHYSSNQSKVKVDNNFKLKQLIIPTSFIGYGFFALNNNGLKSLNRSAKRNFNEDYYYTTTIDNYLQYVPALSVYGLNALGVKGKNNFKNRTIMFGLSSVFSCLMVSPLKSISNMERPDQSAFNSFPSGHTATAFASAEFLHQEYKDVSVWYGVGGYFIASLTGVLRVYNNRHWLSDIVTGAGIGILSTKAAYWIYPYIKRKLFKDKSSANKLLNAEDINKLPVETYDN
ncbi:MAG: phosphatase PAP2 family protein [Ferruginibacter sp.]